MSEVSQPNLIETIEKALAQAKKGRYHVGVIADEWLRALLEENKRLSDLERTLCLTIGEADKALQQIREELERSRGSHMFQYGLSLELEIKRLKAERERLREALEDIADYQHRWSDSPIKEVQKIARSILSQYRTEDDNEIY